MERKIRNELSELIALYKNTTTQHTRSFLYDSIVGLCDVYYDLTEKKYRFFPTLSDINYQHMLEENENRSIHWDLSSAGNIEMVNKFTNNGISVIRENSDCQEYFFENTITFKTAKEIIYSFFEKYDKTLLPFVRNTLENNTVFCDPTIDELGYTNNVRSLRKSYIVLFSNKDAINIEILITLIHELGHTIYNRMLKNKIEYNNFLEVLPYFLEQIFIEYCLKNNIHSIDCLKSQKNDISNLYEWLSDLNIINTYFDKVNADKLSLTLKRRDLKKININNYRLSYKHCEQSYLYSYGVALGFYYATLYEKDPEKTNLYIEAFLKDIGIYRDTYMLSNYGIDNEQFVSCEYLKPFMEKQKILNKNTQN